MAFQSTQWEAIGVLTPIGEPVQHIQTKNSFAYPVIRIQIQSLRRTIKAFSP